MYLDRLLISLKKNPYAIVDVVNGDFDRARQLSFDTMGSRQNVGG
jgi:hypothetical protein